jgi:putative endonuclease
MDHMPHFVYILECADKTLYVGSTNDLQKRLHQHNHLKSGARYTKARRPVALRYSEKQKTLSLALKRECEIKKWTRAKKLLLLRTRKSKMEMR